MTTRRPPVTPEKPSAEVARIAAALREQRTTDIDDVTLARLERSLIQAWRAKASHVESFPRRARRRQPSMWFFGTAVMGAAALGAILGLFLLDHGNAPLTPAGSAQFEMRLGAGAVQRGLLSEGQTLESGRYGHIQVDLGSSRVEIEPRARVRFDRMTPQHLQLTVIEGTIEAHFNPEHEGERGMAVETRAARIVVVGTRFTVAVDVQGNTRVAVSEGIVDVLPKSGKRRRLTAGQRTEVLLDPGDSTEQAVREALTAQLEAGVESDIEADIDDLAEGDQEPLEVPLVVADAQPAHSRPRAASEGRPTNPSAEKRLELARDLLRQGQHQVARRRLRLLARQGDVDALHRVEALTLIAESYTAQGYVPRAADAYREAASVAPPHASAGHNAVFALARLLERYTQDTSGAVSAYERYLRQAPRGSLVGQARKALCRLGEDAHCAAEP